MIWIKYSPDAPKREHDSKSRITLNIIFHITHHARTEPTVNRICTPGSPALTHAQTFPTDSTRSGDKIPIYVVYGLIYS